MKRTITLFATALFLIAAITTFGREARLVRYPHYHNGRVVFTYLGDIWTADENGQNVQRLTVNRARDVYGRFSPDGKWIAFSSERNGNLDVFLIPSGGGNPKQLTSHSADDVVLGWSNDSRSVLFSSNRGEDFTPQLYLVSIDGGMPWKAGTDMGVQASYSPDGKRLAYNQKAQVYWRKYSRRKPERHHDHGRVGEEVYSSDRLRWDRFMAHVGTRWSHLLRQRSRRQRPDQHLARL
ncbi:MAG TPA: hypothetical protein VHS05_12290 [Pyrinomonadaceae bacterium]|jgi:tricorn protease|nr:hypothetical protein [Pyrinomonadaceae bacterium]